MKKGKLLMAVICLMMVGSLQGQFKLDVEGDAKIVGKLFLGQDNQNVFIGKDIGSNSNQGSNTFIGVNIGRNNSSPFNTIIGFEAGKNNTSGGFNTFIGTDAGKGNTEGAFNTFIGYGSGQVSSNSLNKAIAIGHNARVGCHNCAVIGGTGDNAVNVGIGVPAPATPLSIMGNGGTLPVGITQKHVAGAGTATMEFTTADAKYSRVVEL